MKATNDPERWTCGKELRTLFHIWWLCPLIKPFWAVVHTVLMTITDVNLQPTPETYLLQLTTMPTNRFIKLSMPHLLNAAGSLIPGHWKQHMEWMTRVEDIRRIEVLIHSPWDVYNATTTRGTIGSSGSPPPLRAQEMCNPRQWAGDY
ncbi:Hypothetical predicted protein [Pelobates cultripes]|uniref:Uncharacterized protein n=1 Tax=Pelobates cultripes TaxID=61616 RepID=A0AAD1R7M7_PELCU|nr:Hypothetical predicted protein [Pelobates cultripes]